MQVVMELAEPHHGAALRRGPGRGNAGRDPKKPQGARGLSQDMTSATDLAPLVVVEGLHTYYGKSHILHGVSLSVGPGEVVGLLGRNGVGKSTTLKTIMGLVTPSEGKSLFNGQPITGTPAHKVARLGIGYVPEDRRIFKLLTVMKNLRTGLDCSGIAEARKQELLGKVFEFFRYWASGATRPGGRYRGRATDARHRPGHDARAQDHPAGRAHRRPRCRAWCRRSRRLSAGLHGKASPSCSWNKTCP